MNFPIDSYELRARYAPGLIISTPFLITLWTCAPSEFQGLSAFSGGIISVIMWYCVAVFVRYCGKCIEPELWEEWGGNPATNFMLWQDQHIGNDLKEQYHEIISEKLKLPMSTLEEEVSDKFTAIKRTQQAFSKIKGILRKNDSSGLWAIDNAEYGFARNLYGARKAWLAISIAMSLISFVFTCKQWNNLVVLGLMINISMVYFAWHFGGKVLKKMTYDIAIRYSQHVWESFMAITSTCNTEKDKS